MNDYSRNEQQKDVRRDPEVVPPERVRVHNQRSGNIPFLLVTRNAKGVPDGPPHTFRVRRVMVYTDPLWDNWG